MNKAIRVLYSFPHKIGAARICHTAWEQVNGVAEAGANVSLFPGAVHRALPASVNISPTLSWKKIRIPYRLVGSMRACGLHDYIVSKRLGKLAGKVDIIHTWPAGALETLKVAQKLGIPTLLERPNAHTRFAMQIVQDECSRLGISLPKDHEHAFKLNLLQREEEEFKMADRLLCPSDFVLRTFAESGFPREKLVRHQYGFDEKRFYAGEARRKSKGLRMLFVGVCAVRKGVHFALEAWQQSPAHREGTFVIAGDFLPEYAEKLKPMLQHPSVQVLGHRDDIPDLMRKSDVLVLPSLEEGSALVTSEARGAGCVLLVSDAAGAYCRHMQEGLVHKAGDVETLSKQITMLYEDRDLLERLRNTSLKGVGEITWKAAGERLYCIYRDIVEGRL